MAKRFFQMVEGPTSAEIVIYGDICSYPWEESDVSSWGLSQRLAALPDTVESIIVRINSYGGEVAEGVAIYNALKAHKAKTRTVCDGFACSIASVVFMAGDERIMNEASLLMIHNASTRAAGDSSALRKTADDLETITGLSRGIYLAETDLDEETIARMMDNETWLTPKFCVEHGFATGTEQTAASGATQSARFDATRLVRHMTEQLHGAEKDSASDLKAALEAASAKIDEVLQAVEALRGNPAQAADGGRSADATRKLADFFGRI